MFKLQDNFPASLKQKKKQVKIKFLNKYGTTERKHLKLPLTAKEIYAQWKFSDQLARMKMLNLAYTTAK